MKFAKWVFTIAGTYGLIAVTPLYVTETMNGGGALIPHPEYYYGFAGVALAFQIAFLIIGRDPAKYRLLILPSIVEKVSFPAAVIPLYLAGRSPALVAGLSCVDGVIALLFIASWFKTKPV